MDEYRIERLSDKNFRKFHRLYIDVFDSRVDFDFLYNKYDTSYLGVKHIGFLAFDAKDKAICYIGALPFRVQCGNNIYMAVQCCDFMTIKSARKKKLASLLIIKTIDLCRSLGFDFIFAFSNQYSEGLIVNYGDFTKIDTTHVYIINVSCLPISSIVVRLPFLKAIYNKFINKKLKSLENKNYKNLAKKCGILRDKNFYLYKNFSKNHMLEFRHGVVWLKIKGALLVGDLFINKASTLNDLIFDLISFAKKVGVNKIVFNISSSSPLARSLSKHYKHTEGNSILFRKLNDDLTLDPRKLFFTYGDFDSF